MSTLIASAERLTIYKSFQEQVSGYKFKLYLLAKLPSAWFTGVKVVSLSNSSCKTSVPYKWLSQNPFKSTYFACQAMAAELSTGLPAIMAIQKRNPRVSMLVVDMQAKFTKKAVGLTVFECKDVEKIINTVEDAISSGEGKTVTIETIGLNKKGEEISTFTFTWSFKQKSK
ncbi:MAG: DUF4442 domain-containing protein [Chitinophagales bacterium]